MSIDHSAAPAAHLDVQEQASSADSELTWSAYLEHVQTLATAGTQLDQVLQEHRNTVTHLQDQLSHSQAAIEASLQTSLSAVDSTLRRTSAQLAQLQPQGAAQLSNVLSIDAHEPAQALPIDLEEGEVHGQLALFTALTAANEQLEQAIDALRHQHQREAEDLAAQQALTAWQRRRARGIALDAVVLPVVLGAALVGFALLYWSDEQIGPFNAGIWSLLAAGIASAIVGTTGSWICARLNGQDWVDGEDTGGRSAFGVFRTVWAMGLLLYYPAPDIHDWYQPFFNIAAPLAGVVMLLTLLPRARRLLDPRPTPRPAPQQQESTP